MEVCLFVVVLHPSSNGVRRELKIQMALRHKSGLFPVHWQCRFRTLASKVVFVVVLVVVYSCFIYLYLIVNKLYRKWVEF